VTGCSDESARVAAVAHQALETQAEQNKELARLSGEVGGVRCVYDEPIDLNAIGELTIRRASHVEPPPWEAGRPN